MTGLRKISGNNKHSVVLSSDIKEASFVTQTLTSHHVCNRGGFFCLQISSHSRIMRARSGLPRGRYWSGNACARYGSGVGDVAFLAADLVGRKDRLWELIATRPGVRIS